jgi:beta-galactosidase
MAKLNLPHDWAVELPFVRDEEQQSHGYKPLGRRYPETSVGWYRREFEIPSDLGGASGSSSTAPSAACWSL